MKELIYRLRHSFRSKFIMILLLVMFIFLTAMIVLVLVLSRDAIARERAASLHSEAAIYTENIENHLSAIQEVRSFACNYLSGALTDRSADGQSYLSLTMFCNLRDNLGNLENIYNITRIRLFTDSIPYRQDSDHIRFFQMNELSRVFSESPEIADAAAQGRSGWALLTDPENVSKNTRYTIFGNIIAYCAPVFNLGLKQIGVVTLEIDTARFLECCGVSVKEGCVSITDDASRLICLGGRPEGLLDAREAMARGEASFTENGVYYEHIRLKGAPWAVTFALPLNMSSVMNRSMTGVTLAVILLAVFFALLAGLWVCNLFSRRLTRYYDAIREIDFSGDDLSEVPGRLDQLTSRPYPDEIDQIMNSFCLLIRDNLKLLHSMKQRDLDIEKYRFQVLQEQINPHFLYNALETIRLCMSVGQTDNSLRTLDALSKFYRIALSRGRDSIPVRQELEMIDSYLQIENIGYCGKIQWQIDADEALLDVIIPKFLMQPLIENSIIHGKPTSDQGKLHITIGISQVGDMMNVVIANDGVGMTPAELLRLRGNLGDAALPLGSKGFGLRNVNQRLKLFYGSACALSIESGAEGTVNMFSIPLI